MINKKRSGRAEGRLLEVLEKSPLETREPACQEFPACGGCMYQTFSYEAQKDMKEHQVMELLVGAVRDSLAKIGNNGDGSALMKNPELAGKVIKAGVDAVDIPVTVKIRKGFNDE